MCVFGPPERSHGKICRQRDTKLRKGGSLQHSPNNRAGTWLGGIEPREFRENAVPCSTDSTDCNGMKIAGRRHVEHGNVERRTDRTSGLIEILIAGLCRPRARYPYVNRECRLTSLFNETRISRGRCCIDSMMLIHTRREDS